MTIVTVPCFIWRAISASMGTRFRCPAVIFPVLLQRSSANNSYIAADEGVLVRTKSGLGISRSHSKVLLGSIDSRLTQSLLRICYHFGCARKLMFDNSVQKAVLEATAIRLLTVIKEWQGTVP